MSTKALDRVVELWPGLSDEARADIVEIAEGDGEREAPLYLTDEQRRLIEQSREDFRQGRFLEFDEFKTRIDAFIENLAKKASS